MLYSAVVLGIMGSLHCLGMCGPLAMALPIHRVNNGQTNFIRFWLGHLLYNLGRITTYAVMGALLGGLGVALISTGWQQILSIGMGLMILLLLAYQTQLPLLPKALNKLTSYLQKVFSWLMGKRPSAGLHFALGITNGLLPCGLVLVALTMSVWSGNAMAGAAYMALFGVGTLPMMLFAGNIARLLHPVKARKLLRAVSVCVAVLLIVRGLGLGIPYLSPGSLNTGQQIEICH